MKLQKPNVLSLSHTLFETSVLFDHLEISPTSCSIIPETPLKTESYSVLAKRMAKTSLDNYHKDICEHLTNGEMVRCKFCEADIAKIRLGMKFRHVWSNISKVESLLPTDLLAGSEPNTFFCHATSGVTEQPCSPLSRTVANLPVSLALCNGVEVVLHPGAWIQNSTMIVPGSEGLFCSRCRLMLGRRSKLLLET